MHGKQVFDLTLFSQNRTSGVGRSLHSKTKDQKTQFRIGNGSDTERDSRFRYGKV
jgi:hypothetical protein